MTAPGAVAVVVPARDEEELLPACLVALARATDALAAAAPGVRCRTFVVLDSCRDGSAAVVGRHLGVTVVPVQAGCVSAARAAGVEAAAAWAARDGLEPLWLASTDADSEVPPHWLVAQHRLATEGVGLVVGTVVPTPGDLTHAELEEWQRRHELRDGHGHVHGANLGLSLDAYRAVGGFRPLPVHEDVELVRAVRSAGISHAAVGHLAVTTSGRRSSRVPDGFAAYLDGLGA